MDAPSMMFVSKKSKQMKAAIAYMLHQIDEIRAQMKATDADIACMDIQYDVTRAETLALRAETESILARLRTTLGGT